MVNLWCWRRLLRVSQTARRPNQSILKEISPEYSLEGLMLRLKLQYFGHLMQRTNSLEKTLMLGKTEGRRRRRWQRMRWLDDIIHSMDTSLSKLGNWWWTEKLGVLQSWGHKELDTAECELILKLHFIRTIWEIQSIEWEAIYIQVDCVLYECVGSIKGECWSHIIQTMHVLNYYPSFIKCFYEFLTWTRHFSKNWRLNSK